MSNPNLSEAQPTPENNLENNESFGELLAQFDQSHSHKSEGGGKQLQGTVISASAESVFIDIGFKVEGVLPVSAFQQTGVPRPGDKLPVSVKGRNEEGYYELSLFKIAQPKDWTSLEQAFAEKATITGTVTGVVKGGLTVDVGVRAFMPASRSGVRDAAEMEKLVGQEIVCRITKLDVADEDVVVDRRVVMEEQQLAVREQRYGQVKEGDVVQGTVRSLADYGAFVDVGGVDGLLHVSDIAWSRITKPGDVLTEGQQIEVKVLKIDAEQKRISLGLKQLQKHPWEDAPEKYTAGDRVRGTVTRLADFGAFVELEPGVEGLIHVSEMSWIKKVRKPSDILKQGDVVDVVILGMNVGEKRISLGLKQALGDPWADVAQRFPAGSEISGPVTSFTKFGAFVQLAEGVEGMVHVSEISAEKRIQHPQDVLRTGEQVKALVLAIDKDKRQIKLSMKQLIPTGLDEYLAEHKVGDSVSGRTMDERGEFVRVELGEGIQGYCRSSNSAEAAAEPQTSGAVDLSALSSMLKTRWKTGDAPGGSKTEALRAGQVRSFRITKLDLATKRIELELA
ncbi:30S ribosomal protein S1 [Acidobacterium sp. S8]|uniref:30S ribosomal protein S1 n=1 Tax=Acidobacterium sp. S8 TaxID=1641854 RepID=UPI00131E8687|nr:30S ribosomal protein S1 [Acidobacterium sp. S8]